MAATYPRTLSHLGLSVPDLDKAVEFYNKVFGFYIIMPPTKVVKDNSDIGVMCNHVFGDKFKEMRIAHLSTGDRIGIELFEFPENTPPPPELEWWKTSLFHFCIQDPDLEGLLAKVIEHGGKQRMPVCHYFKGDKPYRMVYVEDPFGIVFELYSHSYELTYSAGAYSK